ncbi:hypothetical protein CKO28_10405 [Rhodovibrio sodomensis]|uniref:Uncharacterized protein n=1 Tax=Rhodovibrio sodomensis TaxID=1088 RepID=A0ABS1DDG6_9PROT|nr:hypothetical protein [Rhodovibrio sodomensis]
MLHHLTLSLSSHRGQGTRRATRQASFETVGFANLLRMQLLGIQYFNITSCYGAAREGRVSTHA